MTPQPTTDILTHGSDSPRRLSRRGLVAVGPAVVAGLVAWRSRPVPAPAFTLVDLQGVYAGMVRSDGTNDASIIDPGQVVAEPEDVVPGACEPLFEASVLNRPPPGALDGVGTFWALGPGRYAPQTAQNVMDSLADHMRAVQDLRRQGSR